MSSLQGYLVNTPDLFVGSVLVVVALVVLLARAGDKRNLFFAAFLGVLAIGFILDAVSNVLTGPGWTSAGAPSAAQATWLPLLQRLRVAAQVLDPLFLLAFAVVFCAPSTGSRRLAAFAGGAAFALLAADLLLPVPLPPSSDHGQAIGPFGSAGFAGALLAFELGVYSAVFALLWRDHVSSASEIRQRQGRLVLVGLGIATFSRFGLALESFPSAGNALLSPLGAPGYRLLAYRVAQLVVGMGVALVALWLLLRRTPDEAKPRARRVARGVLAGFAILAAVAWAPVAPYAAGATVALGRTPELDVGSPLGYVLLTLERARFSSRWLVFGGLVAYAIVRFQLFDLPLRLRRAGLRALAVAGVLAGGGFLVLLLVSADPILFFASPTAGILLAFLLALLGAVALSSLDRAFASRSSIDAASMRPRRLEVYQAALERSLEGSPMRDLARLRRELGLSEADEAQARLLAEEAVPLREGLLLAGRYRVRDALGKGSSGRAFLARDEALRRDVVVKEYDDEPSEGASQALAEARAAGALSHPNVVTVHDVVAYGRRHYLVMEWVPGGSVAQKLRGAPSEDADDIVRDVLSALAAVHEAGLVHGDVKPGNVLLAPGGAKLADFGSARVMRSVTLPGPGADARFTPRYAAPEVLAGAPPSPRSDVYSAGVVALDLLDGAAPGTFAQRLDRLASGPRAATAPLLRQMLDAEADARPDARACLAAWDLIAPRRGARSAPRG